jgi:polysaccharide biosynthesis protein PelF
LIQLTTRILLVNWDNYPNHAWGGVYVWAKRLVEGLPDVKFVVINQLTNANANTNYVLPPNVEKVIEVPIFGTHRYEEYGPAKEHFIRKIIRTPESVIEGRFITLFDEFLTNVMSDACDSSEVARAIIKMNELLTTYDAKKCLEHHLTWETFLGHIKRDYLYREMSLREALTVFQSLQRSLQILSIDIPKVDLVHCSLVWVPSLVALVARAKFGSPIIFTEHGVAYRELMLYYNAYLFNEPSKIFWKVVSRNIIRPLYESADVVAPVCKANAGWERALGANPSKIRVIYNGINTERFKPTVVQQEDNSPTVVSVARIDPFKDITTLAYAIKYAREKIPNIRCLLFGDSNNLDYSIRCVNVVKEQHLEPNFKFMGSTKEPEKAYNLADVVVFNGITEGFPFAVIEAMACGKPIVATEIGGVAEALEGCGILIKSRDPESLAREIVRLLQDEKLRKRLGAAALQRARAEFSIETSIYKYRELYQELTARSDSRVPQEVVIAQ